MKARYVQEAMESWHRSVAADEERKERQRGFLRLVAWSAVIVAAAALCVMWILR